MDSNQNDKNINNTSDPLEIISPKNSNGKISLYKFLSI